MTAEWKIAEAAVDPRTAFALWCIAKGHARQPVDLAKMFGKEFAVDVIGRLSDDELLTRETLRAEGGTVSSSFRLTPEAGEALTFLM